MGIGFLWCLPNCFLIDSSVEYWFANQRIVLIERFLSSNLSMQIRMNGFLHPFCLLTLMSFCHLTQRSFCTQGLPGVAESTFQKSKENLLLWEEEAWQGGWGGIDKSFSSPNVLDVPSSPGGCGFIHVCGFCDFAFGFAQNDRGSGASCEDGRFGIIGTKKRESGLMV